jgi:hypothetical protein
MPPTLQRADELASGVLPGDVKRVLVGFSARVAEEDPVQRAGAQLGESLGEYLAVLMRDSARIKEEPLSLLRDGPNDVRMRVAGGRNGVPAVGVEPLVAGFIDQPGSPAADGTDGELGVDGEEGGSAARRLGGSGTFRLGGSAETRLGGCVFGWSHF